MLILFSSPISYRVHYIFLLKAALSNITLKGHDVQKIFSVLTNSLILCNSWCKVSCNRIKQHVTCILNTYTQATRWYLNGGNPSHLDKLPLTKGIQFHFIHHIPPRRTTDFCYDSQPFGGNKNKWNREVARNY